MTESKLLGNSEQKTCEQIAASAAGLDGKRAAALLALNAGATQTDAAAQASLTLGQVRYLLTLFRNKGMGLFTAATPAPKPAAAKAPAAKVEAPSAPAPAKKEKAGKGDKKKDKKTKDKKKKDKDSKKKDKKGKKSKKKK